MKAVNEDCVTAGAVRNSVKKSVAGCGGLLHRQHRSGSSLLSTRTPILPKQRGRQLLLLLVLIFVLAFSCLHNFHTGFRRSCEFWRLVAPLVAEYKLTTWKATYLNEEEYNKRLDAFHKRTAPKAVKAAGQMGGIFIKIGQFISTLGAGIVREEYVQAMKPVLNDITPRGIDEIKEIFEQSTGRKVQDVFESFDEKPIGAASIAQAHRATLRTDGSQKQKDNEVIVKVQYLDVSEQLLADLNNMELVIRLLFPAEAADDLARSVREKHERELDFRMEADNLRECSENMQRHGMEPQKVRIPRVRNETGLCTENILIMEYLRGISLSDAIQDEQDRLARALGYEDGEEFRSKLGNKIREHLESDGSDENDGASQGGKIEDGVVSLLFDGDDNKGASKIARSITTGGPFMGLFRTYANLREGVGTFNQNVRCFLFRDGKKCAGDDKSTGANNNAVRKKSRHVNIARALKTLIHVHGLQMIKDGVYNADPHPGNVLIMDDGRLGLLDYGMVVRMNPNEKEPLAKAILALAREDKNETVNIYNSAGFKIQTWLSGEDITDVNIVHRVAVTHFDKFDLSPMEIMDRETQEYTKVPAFKVLSNIRERSIPDWIENGRRLAGLMIGVSAQAARPISLAKEWASIAEESLAGSSKRRGRKKSKQKQIIASPKNMDARQK